MSAKLRIVGILTMAGACSAGAAFAASCADPHERARDMIAPAFPAKNAAPAGVQGRLIQPHDFGDPHVRAERLMRHNEWPSMAAQAAAGRTPAGSGYSDPHRRAQSMILGRER